MYRVLYNGFPTQHFSELGIFPIDIPLFPALIRMMMVMVVVGSTKHNGPKSPTVKLHHSICIISIFIKLLSQNEDVSLLEEGDL